MEAPAEQACLPTKGTDHGARDIDDPGGVTPEVMLAELPQGYRRAQGGTTGWWCGHCGVPVLLIGGSGVPEQLRKAVHAATGHERGFDGHLAAPLDYEPPLWKAARELAAEFEGVFTISARFRFLRADWARLPPGVVAGHFEAPCEEEMRQKLKAAIARTWQGTALPEADQ